MSFRNFFLLAAVLAVSICEAQPGSWILPGSNNSYPRVLTTDSSLQALRNSLSSGVENLAYGNVCNDAFSGVNSDNITDNGRRQRASEAKNAAFVLYINSKFGAGSLIALTNAESLILKAKALSLLSSMNTFIDSITVSNLNAYDSWQWRSKEIIDYAIAYDFLKGAGVNDNELSAGKKKLQQFAGNLYKEAGRNIFGITFWDLVKNNFQFIVAGALGTTAVVLNMEDSSDQNYKPVNWVNCALWQINDQLFNTSNRETDKGKMAGFAEGPHYMLYSFQHMLPFFSALKNFAGDFTSTFTFHGIPQAIRNPYYDPAYKLLYQWIANIMMPDGRIPALDDSFMDEYPSLLLLTGNSAYYFDYYYGKGNTQPVQTNFISTLNFAGQDLVVNFLCSGVLNTSTATSFKNDSITVMPDAGSLIFHSGSDSLSTYMHINAEHGVAHNSGGGHNHADELSFILYSGGQLLALDPGYISYNQRNDVCNASSHNMILVDNAGTTAGSPGFSGGSEAFIESAFQLPSIQYGLAHTSYNSANISRKTIFVRGKYFMMGDFMSSSFSRKYTWQLHGFGLENGNAGTGRFTDSLYQHKAIWIKNGVSLLANVAVTGGADGYFKSTSKHESGYTLTADHTALLVNKQNAKAQFATALIPFQKLSPFTYSISTNTAAYMEVAMDGNYDLMITASDSLLHAFPSSDHAGLFPAANIKAEASMIFLSCDSQKIFKTLFIQNAKSFENTSDSNFFRISLDKYMDLALEANDRMHYSGFASAAGSLKLITPYTPSKISGQHIRDWNYDTASLVLTINTTDSAYFSFEMDTVIRHSSRSGIRSNSMEIMIRLFPNPSGPSARIENLGSHFQLLRISNTLGQVCYASDISGLDSYRFNTTLQPGVYFVECIGSEARQVIRWIVE
jgi:hypothetical protein